MRQLERSGPKRNITPYPSLASLQYRSTLLLYRAIHTYSTMLDDFELRIGTLQAQQSIKDSRQTRTRQSAQEQIGSK